MTRASILTGAIRTPQVHRLLPEVVLYISPLPSSISRATKCTFASATCQIVKLGTIASLAKTRRRKGGSNRSSSRTHAKQPSENRYTKTYFVAAMIWEIRIGEREK